MVPALIFSLTMTLTQVNTKKESLMVKDNILGKQEQVTLVISFAA